MIYSGAINEMANHDGYYQSLVDQCMGKDTLATDEIGAFFASAFSKFQRRYMEIKITSFRFN